MPGRVQRRGLVTSMRCHFSGSLYSCFLYCLKVRSCLADVICSQNVCDIFENENFFLQIFNLQIIKNHVLVENLVDFSQFALPRSSPHLN